MNRFQPVITKLIFGLLMLLSGVCLSQIDGATINTTGENPFFQPTPSSLVPENKPPVSLTIPFKDRDPKMQFPPPSQEPQQLDMTASDGLLDYIPGKSPKAFQKDKL